MLHLCRMLWQRNAKPIGFLNLATMPCDNTALTSKGKASSQARIKAFVMLKWTEIVNVSSNFWYHWMLVMLCLGLPFNTNVSLHVAIHAMVPGSLIGSAEIDYSHYKTAVCSSWMNIVVVPGKCFRKCHLATVAIY